MRPSAGPREDVNVTGQAYGLTVITPILAGREQALRDELDHLPKGEDGPLARVAGTHFGRWVIIPRLPHGGPPQRRDELRFQHLLFSSTFDTPRDEYLDRLCEHMAQEAHAIWRNCAGYPGSIEENPEAFKRYLCRNQLATGLFFAAYADATVDQVRRGLGRRKQLQEFVVEARGKGPAQLQEDFRLEFSGPEPDAGKPGPDAGLSGA